MLRPEPPSVLRQRSSVGRRKRFLFRRAEPPLDDDDDDISFGDNFSCHSTENSLDTAQQFERVILRHHQEANNNNDKVVIDLPDDDCSSGSSSDSYGSSLSTMVEMQQQLVDPAVSLLFSSQEQTAPPDSLLHSTSLHSSTNNKLQQYMDKRNMTPTQELWNAITIIPNPIYCIYFLLSGMWIRPEFYNTSDSYYTTITTPRNMTGFAAFANYALGADENGCLSTTTFLGHFQHGMYALPPLPVMAVAFGILCHAPFSFLYHYKYAHALGAARSTHWSRRMDQAMIHFGSACMSYATSGSWDFFMANVLFNVDSMYRQLFKRAVKPRRNQVRLVISFIAYTLPILWRGDVRVLIPLYSVFGVAGWLFIFYPIGGWSHTAFHLVIALTPPLLMMAATELPRSQEQMRLAAMCAAMATEQN